MSTNSKIEWTERTWNPTTGCDQVSPGCGLPRSDGDEPHGTCYALTLAKRLKAMGQAKYQNDGDPHTSGPGFAATEHEAALTEPLRWRKPSKVFVNSMSDLFHDAVSDEFIARVWAVMAATPQHTYQVLTKRHGRMRSLLNRESFRDAVREPAFDLIRSFEGIGYVWPLPNVWLGVSVENQKYADLRIPKLLETPAAVRFLSCEPLLGPVDLEPWLNPERACERCDAPCSGCPFDRAVVLDEDCDLNTGHQPVRTVDWVIVGGESGPGARPMHPAWARSLRDQCAAGGVAFHFKQWGEWAPDGFGIGKFDLPEQLIGPAVDDWGYRQIVRRVGKHAAGRELDGRTHDEFPTPPLPEVAS